MKVDSTNFDEEVVKSLHSLGFGTIEEISQKILTPSEE